MFQLITHSDLVLYSVMHCWTSLRQAAAAAAVAALAAAGAPAITGARARVAAALAGRLAWRILKTRQSDIWHVLCGVWRACWQGTTAKALC